MIVLGGFILSSVLIWESFDNWGQNPVATIISTYPIGHVTFPKIYVCPPKGTYTNLNQDIVENNNVYLTDEQVEELMITLDEVAFEVSKDERLKDLRRQRKVEEFRDFLKTLLKATIDISRIILSLNKLNFQLTKLNQYTERNITVKFFKALTEKLSLKHFLLKQLNLGYLTDAIPFLNMKSQDYLNHPAHILNNSNSFNPSSFIPFCSFGGDMSIVGKKIDQFPVPVCNKFVKTVLNDQVCYSIDINELKKEADFSSEALKIGLNIFLDYNEERQTYDNKKLEDEENKDFLQANFLSRKAQTTEEEALIYFSTLSKTNQNITQLIVV